MDEQPINDLLQSYLNETLPTLGLDSETYSQYVIGCLANSGEEGGDSLPLPDDGDGQQNEELNQIIELLQASSESHSDDDSVWDKLKSEVLKYHREFMNQKREKKNAELLELKKVS